MVDPEWQSYGVALKPNVAFGQIDDETLDLLFHNSLSVLRVAHAAVGVMEAEFGKSSIKPFFATGINIAGRQRMLTQRAAKEYCFAVSGIQPTHNVEALHGTMGLFEDSLFGLAFGSTDLGLIEPKITLEWQFLELLNLWYYMQDRLEDGLAHASDLSPDAMAQIGEISNLLLVESNRAVSMYVDWALRFEEDQTASPDQQNALY